MARAKTTDRADARRRYRAQLAAEAAVAEAAAGEVEVEAASGEAEAAGIRPNVVAGGGTPNVIATARSRGRGGSRSTQSRGGTATSGTPARAGTGGQAARPSVFAALRTAATPADIPADIRAFPEIATRTKAVWLPALLLVVTGAAFLVPTLAENTIVRLLGQALLAPPAMIPSFVAGMLTPRAAWLAGGVAGLIAGLVVAVLFVVAPSTAASTQGLDFQNLAFLVGVAPVFGMGVGAFSGFYRRFLASSTPPRQQRRPAQGSKGSPKRR